MFILVISLLLEMTEPRVQRVAFPLPPPAQAHGADPRPHGAQASRHSDPALLQLWRLFPRLGGRGVPG